MNPPVTVHIVDDDAALRAALSLQLRVQGFTPKTYALALDLLAVSPDELSGCVLTDVRMPKMSGLELVEALKVRRPDLPVVVMSAHGDIAMAVEAMRAGVVDFIEKPFGKAALLAALGLSPRTVEIYRAKLMAKMGVRHVSDLMRVVFGLGL